MKTLFSSTVTILLATFVVGGAIWAFTLPTSAPPAGNVAAPLNVSSSAQIKDGGLTLNWLGYDNGLVVYDNGDSTKGFVGIGTLSPQSKLQVVGGYVQLDVGGAPAGTDCDAAAEEGRTIFDPTADLLYICSGASGWVTK